jgi:hypothetical protein
MNRDDFIKAYIDFVNDYLTIEKYADHHGLHAHEARAFIELARQVYNAEHPDS